MKLDIQCPYRGNHAVGLFDSRCAVCNRDLSLAELKKHYKWKFQHTVQTMTLTECPNCEFVEPLDCQCPRCKTPFNLRTAALAFIAVLIWHAKELLATSGGPRIFQRRFLSVSGLILCAVMGIYEWDEKGISIGCIFLSVFYLVLLGLFIKWFVSRETLVAINEGTSTTVKIALLVNYVSFVLTLQMLIGSWLAQACIILMVFFVTGFSAWFLCNYAWPNYERLRKLFYDDPNSIYDPTNPDGRTGRHD